MRTQDLNDEIDRRYGNPVAFCRALRDKLKEHGITQSAFAREAGYDLGNVNRWLNARHRVPSLPTMLILDEAFERILEDK